MLISAVIQIRSKFNKRIVKSEAILTVMNWALLIFDFNRSVTHSLPNNYTNNNNYDNDTTSVR